MCFTLVYTKTAIAEIVIEQADRSIKEDVPVLITS